MLKIIYHGEGKYWNSDSEVKAILQKLKPSNDLCESILGLNDYLTTTIPNMLQLTRSNLVEVKKNNTINWYDSLPQEQKDKNYQHGYQEESTSHERIQA